MIVYLIRHGVTDWNLVGKAQGREDIDLNEGGVLQAKFCAEGLKNVQIDCVVTSPLKRAKKTAEAIYEYHKNADFRVMDAFIERDLGRYSGLDEAGRQAMREKGIASNSEPRPVAAKRAIEGLVQLEKEYSDKHVAVVTHGGIIGAVLELLEYAAIDTIFLENVFVTELELTGADIKVLRCNIAPDKVVSGNF